MDRGRVQGCYVLRLRTRTVGPEADQAGPVEAELKGEGTAEG